MATLSDHIQNPFQPAKVIRTDALFTTRSGHKLKMRQVTIQEDGSKLQVPQYISRQVFPDTPGYLNATKWIITISGVDFYVRDDEGTPAASLEKACRIMYENYGAPLAVLKALKAASKLERRRKNILTGVPGLTCQGKFKTGRLEYNFRLQNALPKKAYVPGASFDPFSHFSVQGAYNEMMTVRHYIKLHSLTTPEEVIAIHRTIQQTPSLLMQYKMPDDLVCQIKDNYAMRMAVKKGSGVRHSVTGKLIKG